MKSDSARICRRSAARTSRDFCAAVPIWLTKNLPLDTIRKEAETMEFEAERFYVKAAEQTTGCRRPPACSAISPMRERPRNDRRAKLAPPILTRMCREEENETRHRMFVLQYVQPGLAG